MDLLKSRLGGRCCLHMQMGDMAEKIEGEALG